MSNKLQKLHETTFSGEIILKDCEINTLRRRTERKLALITELLTYDFKFLITIRPANGYISPLVLEKNLKILLHKIFTSYNRIPYIKYNVKPYYVTFFEYLPSPHFHILMTDPFLSRLEGEKCFKTIFKNKVGSFNFFMNTEMHDHSDIKWFAEVGGSVDDQISTINYLLKHDDKDYHPDDVIWINSSNITQWRTSI